jgi:ribokinase
MPSPADTQVPTGDYDIAVVGSHAYGLYLTCERMPTPGETVIGRDFRSLMDGDGGKGTNQAICAARLGARLLFIGKVGDDRAADIAEAALKAENIDTRYLYRTAESYTGVGVVLVDSAGESMIVVDPGASNLLTRQEVAAAAPDMARATHFLTQFEQPVDITLFALRQAKSLGLVTVLNPAPVPDLASCTLECVDILTPNETEARLLAGIDGTGEVPAETVVRAIQERWAVPNIVMTRGAAGVFALCEGRIFDLPAFPVEAVDSTGAGDAFSAALVVARCRGADWCDALEFASAAGAISVTASVPWRSYPTPDQIGRFLDSHGRNPRLAFATA